MLKYCYYLLRAYKSRKDNLNKRGDFCSSQIVCWRKNVSMDCPYIIDDSDGIEKLITNTSSGFLSFYVAYMISTIALIGTFIYLFL